MEKLLDNGADLVGKTVCDELCYSISGENWNYGSPINPHDVRRYTGGSSSGACAAVAGGLVDFSIGSDCLGSVRVPAAYNGLIGMRPSYKRVDNGGEAPYCESMDVLGFVATESEIFRNVGHVLLGDDEKDYTFNRILIADDCFDAINSDVREALQPAIDTIVEAVGSDLEHISLTEHYEGGLAEWVKIFQLVQGYEVWESYGGFVNKYKPNLSPGPKSRLEFASSITQTQYRDSLEKMKEISDIVMSKIPEDALLIIPTASSVAPLRSAAQEEINEYRAQSSQLLCVSPLSGVPQITLPLVKQHEVPLGISILGSFGSDMAMVNFASDLMNDKLGV